MNKIQKKRPPLIIVGEVVESNKRVPTDRLDTLYISCYSARLQLASAVRYYHGVDLRLVAILSVEALLGCGDELVV